MQENGEISIDCLAYPFDSDDILKKKKKIKRELLASDALFIEKKIAVLGGSTTAEIKNILELFLLNYGIRPTFYESEYAQYWQDAMFGEELEAFEADVVYIHTTSRNIMEFPSLRSGEKQVQDMLEREFKRFSQMWDKLLSRGCCVIQNNFERPVYRLLGNYDISDFRGHSHFISRLNHMFYEYAQRNSGKGFYINDIDYLSASFGLDQWQDPSAWYMYKYALCIQAIPELAFSVARIIKSIYGKNKKVLVLDLDNTLWGGVVGDDGVEMLELGPETPEGQAYAAFQEYVKAQTDLGILLAVCSKNDLENAISGLEHPNSKLAPSDFAAIKANWDNKDRNVLNISMALNIGADSLVFIDDNPAERAIVAAQVPGIAVPEIGNVEEYIRRMDKSGFFEVTTITDDDLSRGRMYRENALREKAEQRFEKYDDYLVSLEMSATIRDFEPHSIHRIAQLTNKTNQFNLTTRRYSEGDILAISADDRYIRLCGRLQDKFGDNGVVSIIIGRKEDKVLHIDLWLMSCRVFKRGLEYAMMDRLVEACQNAGVIKIFGYYCPTAKNNMVRGFYGNMGFNEQGSDGSSVIWAYDVGKHKPMNRIIDVR